MLSSAVGSNRGRNLHQQEMAITSAAMSTWRIGPLNKSSPESTEVLRLVDLAVHFPVTRGVWKRKVGTVKAVDGVDLSVLRGETLGLVGESGCGKTTIGRTVIRLYKPTTGQVWFEGQDISRLGERALRPVRRRMSLVFQDPSGSLDPRRSAGSIVGEPLKIHRLVESKRAYHERIEELQTGVQSTA